MALPDNEVAGPRLPPAHFVFISFESKESLEMVDYKVNCSVDQLFKVVVHLLGLAISGAAQERQARRSGVIKPKGKLWTP